MAEQKLETFYPGNYIFVILFVFVFEDMCVAAGSTRRKLKEEVFRRSVSLLRQSEGGGSAEPGCRRLGLDRFRHQSLTVLSGEGRKLRNTV